MSEAIDVAARILAEHGVTPRRNAPLAPLTSFRIGGPAALFVEPDREQDLRGIAAAVAASGVPVVVVGKGSNILVSDAGYDGIVVRLGSGYRWAARDGDLIHAGGAMPLPALAGVALRHGLSGLAFGVAIPASVGGAVRMNAGAHGGQVGDVVEQVDVFVIGTARTEAMPASQVGFAYRHTDLPADAVVIGARLRLQPGDAADIRAEMDEAREWRRATQPLAEANCGSVFTNPPGAHAAALVDEAGLKGSRIGGAHVSTKHANFIIADPGAKATDVRALIRMIRERVSASTGIELIPEVRLVGDFDA
jgi:UDP-N-acetylmuramate dehydrogenase